MVCNFCLRKRDVGPSTLERYRSNWVAPKFLYQGCQQILIEIPDYN